MTSEPISRLLRAVVLGAASLALGGCSDGRPEEETARAWFESRYSGAVVTGVRISEDEVAARSFRFTYRSAEEAREREIEVQFMESDSGQWQPRPAEPGQLP